MKTILLIEDNEDILENLTEYFEMEGYKILFASNGKEGVELARKFVPDLIICDVLMREMDGHEVLRLLLDSSKTCGIPLFSAPQIQKKLIEQKRLNWVLMITSLNLSNLKRYC